MNESCQVNTNDGLYSKTFEKFARGILGFVN